MFADIHDASCFSTHLCDLYFTNCCKMLQNIPWEAAAVSRVFHQKADTTQKPLSHSCIGFIEIT